MGTAEIILLKPIHFSHSQCFSVIVLMNILEAFRLSIWLLTAFRFKKYTTIKFSVLATWSGHSMCEASGVLAF